MSLVVSVLLCLFSLSLFCFTCPSLPYPQTALPSQDLFQLPLRSCCTNYAACGLWLCLVLVKRICGGCMRKAWRKGGRIVSLCMHEPRGTHKVSSSCTDRRGGGTAYRCPVHEQGGWCPADYLRRWVCNLRACLRLGSGGFFLNHRRGVDTSQAATRPMCPSLVYPVMVVLRVVTPPAPELSTTRLGLRTTPSLVHKAASTASPQSPRPSLAQPLSSPHAAQPAHPPPNIFQKVCTSSPLRHPALTLFPRPPR
ncbi:hypothetical protein CALVIDRAFT_266520 [Calocera viscosa TUFC12733]|uniref:Secreted protein n=1 Tax=Calocera viscosa (strain TUFC12733) TaxID=1330018 RepID=A0A167IWX6_CALVF|nr:hypothetical protein CALVIDRAFT_266520 [Calocera viscosa TUFC12733]